MVMTVITHDSATSLGGQSRNAYHVNELFDILYADDTLLLGLDVDHVSEFATAVENIGTTYGMSLHWG